MTAPPLDLFPPVNWGVATETFVFLVAMSVFVVGAVVARAPRRTQLLLAAVLGLGALLRGLLAPDTLMDMSNYEREPVLFRWFQQSGFSPQLLFPDGWDRWQQILALDLVVSCLLPLVVFAHAQVCFGDPRISLFATALFAICPIPIYFARSDNLYITSALLSSTTFVLLHAAMSARFWLEELLAGLAAVALFGITLSARQENFLFGGLAVAPAALALWGGGKGRFRRAAWALALLVIGFRAYWETSKWQVGGDTATVADTAALVFHIWTPDPVKHLLWTNNYLFKPWILPLPFTLLAVAGLVWTWRHRRSAFVYVFWWFSVFYVGHGVIPAWDDTAAARYGMHTIIPLLFAAAFGLAWALEAFRGWSPAPSTRLASLGGAAVFALASGAWGGGLFRQPESDVQAEYRFLRELSARSEPPAGALVIENYGNYSKLLRDGTFFAIKTRNRFDYFGVRARGGRQAQEIASARTFVPGHSGPVYLYLGLPCLWLRRGAERSKSCAAALASASWEKVASRRVTERPHDNANGDPADGGEIALYRLVGPVPSPPPVPIDEQPSDQDVLLNPIRR
jgi:hypothetical protein